MKTVKHPETIEDVDFLMETKNDYQNSTRPSDIKVSDANMVGFFGKAEVEEAAGKLVKFFQVKNHWHEFSFAELIQFYKRNQWNVDEILFGLHGNWYDTGGLGEWREGNLYIGQTNEGKLLISDYFISKCCAESK